MNYLKKINIYQLSIHIILFILCAIVWMLTNQNKNLRVQLTEKVNKQFIKLDEQVLSFEAFDISGNKYNFVTIDTLQKKEKLLFFFSATCPFCSQNIENWKRLFFNFNNVLDIYGIGIGEVDEINEYASSNKLPYQIFIPTSKEFRKENKIGGVPLTILLSNTGIVKDVWIGLMDTDEVVNTLNKKIN